MPETARHQPARRWRLGRSTRIGGLAALIAAVAVGTWCLGVWASRADPRDAFARPSAVQQYAAATPLERLGCALFFDPILSGPRTIACVNCHVPELGWTDGRSHAVGVRGPITLRAPTLLDVADAAPLGWDGKFPSAGSVIFTAITGPANMGGSESEALARLQSDPRYVDLYRVAFPDAPGGPVTRRNTEEAMVSFLRRIRSGPAPFDRWVAGDPSAIGPEAQRGFALFVGKAGCSQCHSGWRFTDDSFHDIGLAREDEPGRGRLFPSSLKLKHAFKTPTLRDVALRRAFMHDGSLKTLQEVIDAYDRGGTARPSRSELIRPLNLTATEKSELVAFLRTLTSETPGTIPERFCPWPLPSRSQDGQTEAAATDGHP